jgi:hypothetical protein
MILPGSEIRVYDNSLAQNNSFFTGGLNLQKLEFDPLVTGYAFIIWVKVPSWVQSVFPGFKSMTEKNFLSFDGLSDIELQTQSYQYGFANNDYHVAAGITKNNTEFTIKHQEYSGSPIKNAYSYWVSGIADPETGIPTYPVVHNIDYAAKNHTGALLYIVTRPDANNVGMKNIEFSAYITNVMPTKIPLGQFAYDQGNHDLVQIDIPLKGNMHIGPKVDAFAHKMLKNAYTFVTEDMFDPENGGNYTGKTIGDYTPGGGISGSGTGDTIVTHSSQTLNA